MDRSKYTIANKIDKIVLSNSYCSAHNFKVRFFDLLYLSSLTFSY